MKSPRYILNAHEIRPSKRLGQNFLSDQNIALMIVKRALLDSSDIVLEIGPGLGALTIPTARVVSKLVTVEKDTRLARLLRTELLVEGIDNVSQHEGDILAFDFDSVFPENGQQIIVIGNLPYNISSQLLIRMVRERSHISRAIFMFQKELADRIRSLPGSRDYGRISAMLQYCSDMKEIARIEPGAFYPKPRVASAVLEIRFREPEKIFPGDEEFLFRIIKAGFGQRRKTLKNALVGSEFHMPPDLAGKILETSGISPSRRAETLSPVEFVRLAIQAGEYYA